jgi:hypothetical protein
VASQAAERTQLDEDGLPIVDLKHQSDWIVLHWCAVLRIMRNICNELNSENKSCAYLYIYIYIFNIFPIVLASVFNYWEFVLHLSIIFQNHCLLLYEPFHSGSYYVDNHCLRTISQRELLCGKILIFVVIFKRNPYFELF